MKFLSCLIAPPICALLLASCETSLRSAPPVTTAFVRAGGRENADTQTLEEGRTVFINRCISCHALPAIGRYDPKRIPKIVNWMSHRAHLSQDQNDALLKYLLTVRSHSP